ncbi:hypothetical protein [Acetomicrobium sp. S15 = DSM 107314]|uniref:hypothetical protein n=1 Tax=Acetomicrobium sp. S15 = DSM 107314 TaxID=2529858 RepID=UPI0018E1B699|nr:hypothetical protein [Acetomicrobium sp. S15 = DSM 107314]
MATQNSWGSAVKGLWGNLLKGSGIFITLRWAFLILLALGFLWSLSLFVNMVNFSKDSFAIDAAEKMQRSLPELSALAEEAKVVYSARSGEVFSVGASARRYLFAPLPEKVSTASYASADEGTFLYTEPMPPITVKGVMLMGKKTLAVISIGSEEGILAEAGYTFGNGKGRIESISSDKVVVSWVGEKKEIFLMP